MKHNALRRVLQHYFPKNSLFTLPPCKNEELFQTQKMKLLKMVHTPTEPVHVEGYTLTGYLWDLLMNKYISDLLDESVPCTRAAVQHFVQENCKRKMHEALACYDQRTAGWDGHRDTDMIMLHSQALHCAEQIWMEAVAHLQPKDISLKEPYENSLKEQIQRR